MIQLLLYIPSPRLDLDLDTISHPAVVVASGRVYIIVMSDFTAYCSMDLTYWPYDEHTCTSILGSRSYTGSHLDFEFNEYMVLLINIFYTHVFGVITISNSDNIDNTVLAVLMYT